MRIRLLAVVAVTAALLAGCGESTDTPGTTTAPTTTETPADDTTTVPPSTTAPPVDTTAPPDEDGAMTGPVAKAIADLAERLDIDPGEIEILLTEDVVWPNGAIGCPEPGVGYTQALVDGWRAVLDVDGSQYFYHAARDQDPFYCENPSDPLPGDPDA